MSVYLNAVAEADDQSHAQWTVPMGQGKKRGGTSRRERVTQAKREAKQLSAAKEMSRKRRKRWKGRAVDEVFV